ncbi:MAG: histidine phosphatase family protein [Oscillospiraceae bacterium]|nr:histidine phosphatase family protein [Oscillospiraceae bacterium]
MKLTLIRHGLTEGNLRRLYYGGADIPLAPEGEAELRRLRETAEYPRGRDYYTSGMVRTEQTFAILYGDTPHTQVPGLREMNFGAWEMQSYEDLKDDPVFQEWCSGDVEQHRAPGGDSFQMVYDRVGEAIAPILARGRDAVCVVHGGVIVMLLRRWFPADLAQTYARTPEPGHGYQIVFDDDGKPVSFTPIP